MSGVFDAAKMIFSAGIMAFLRSFFRTGPKISNCADFKKRGLCVEISA